MYWCHGDHPHQEGGLPRQTALSQLPIKVSDLSLFILSILEEMNKL